MKSIVLALEDTRRIVEQVGLNRLMDETIDALRNSFRSYVPEQITCPARSGFQYHDPVTGLLEWMPIMDSTGNATIKIVGYHPANPTLAALPTILSTVSSYDTKTGHLLAIADGTLMTALRTGAASAVASEVLARPESATIGLVGCGTQAVTQLHALTRVFSEIRTVLLFDREANVEGDFTDRISILGLTEIDFRRMPMGEVLRHSDLICTSTSVEVGKGPVFDDVELNPWVHINAVGSDFPDKVELPLSLLRRSLVCPDFPEQARREGECQQLSDEEIGPSLVELVKDPEHFEYARDLTTVFDSTGWALQDHLVMGLLVDYAKEFGLGCEVQIECSSADPRNPYHFIMDSPEARMHPTSSGDFARDGSATGL